MKEGRKGRSQLKTSIDYAQLNNTSRSTSFFQHQFQCLRFLGLGFQLLSLVYIRFKPNNIVSKAFSLLCGIDIPKNFLR